MVKQTDDQVGAKTYDTLIQRITADYDGLSKRLKQIAAYALDNPNEFAIKTIAEIAVAADVQPSAIIRFAKALDFDGFTEVQKLFQKRLLDLTPTYQTRLKVAKATHQNDLRHLLTQFADRNIAALQQLQQNIKTEQLKQAIAIMSAADTVYILAMRRAYPLAAFIFYAMSSMGRRCQIIDNTGGLYQKNIQQIQNNDVLLVASYANYTSYVVDAAKIAFDNGIPVIAITDHQLSPLTQTATVCFHVAEASVHEFRSLSASMCLAQSLVIGLGITDNTGEPVER